MHLAGGTPPEADEAISRPAPTPPAVSEPLTARLQKLEEQVAELARELAELKKSLGS